MLFFFFLYRPIFCALFLPLLPFSLTSLFTLPSFPFFSPPPSFLFLLLRLRLLCRSSVRLSQVFHFVRVGYAYYVTTAGSLGGQE